MASLRTQAVLKAAIAGTENVIQHLDVMGMKVDGLGSIHPCSLLYEYWMNSLVECAHCCQKGIQEQSSALCKGCSY